MTLSWPYKMAPTLYQLETMRQTPLALAYAPPSTMRSVRVVVGTLNEVSNWVSSHKKKKTWYGNVFAKKVLHLVFSVKPKKISPFKGLFLHYLLPT